MCPGALTVSDGRVAHDTVGAVGLDEKTAALAGLAALVALRAAPHSYPRCVDRALAAGASVDDMIDALKLVAPSVGLARVVSAAPALALALGYDIDSALETLDPPQADAAARSGISGDGRDRRDATDDPADAVGEPSP
jgi:4-carboxymuconolactone decarboxylase